MITVTPHYVVSLPYCHITITLPLPSEAIATIPIRVIVIASSSSSKIRGLKALIAMTSAFLIMSGQYYDFNRIQRPRISTMKLGFGGPHGNDKVSLFIMSNLYQDLIKFDG